MRKKQYKRPIEYPYDNAYFLADAANAAALYPKFLNIGGLVLTHPPTYSSSHLFTNQPLTLLFFLFLLTETPTAPTPSQASTSPLLPLVFSPQKISLPKKIVLLVLLISLLRKLNRIYLVRWML